MSPPEPRRAAALCGLFSRRIRACPQSSSSAALSSSPLPSPLGRTRISAASGCCAPTASPPSPSTPSKSCAPPSASPFARPVALPPLPPLARIPEAAALGSARCSVPGAPALCEPVRLAPCVPAPGESIRSLLRASAPEFNRSALRASALGGQALARPAKPASRGIIKPLPASRPRLGGEERSPRKTASVAGFILDPTLRTRYAQDGRRRTDVARRAGACPRLFASVLLYKTSTHTQPRFSS